MSGVSHEPTLKNALAATIRGGMLRLPDHSIFKVGLNPLLIGRDTSCDVVLEDPEVSATHCELKATASFVCVTDLDSSNGTYINGVRVREALLEAPCTLRIGKTLLTFELLEDEQIELDPAVGFGRLAGCSTATRQIFRVLREVARTDLSVLISGDTGTGKEVVAQEIHDNSLRKDKPLVVVDCGSIPSPLAESILFGHERGAFTGANERTAGAFLEANGGTIFLDELGELPLEIQPKLLRVLAERQVKRVGGSKYEPTDVRVVAATRRKLPFEMNAGRFRTDLFFRVAQVRIEIAPLRERREDIPLIVRAFCARIGRSERAADVVDLVARQLDGYDWPGNVRELLNVAEVATSLPPGSAVLIDMLPLERRSSAAPVASAFAHAKSAALKEFEGRYFSHLQTITDANISEMARQSGLARHQIRAYLRKNGLKT